MNVQIMTGAAHPTHGNAGIDRLFKPNGIYDTSLKFLFPFDIANWLRDIPSNYSDVDSMKLISIETGTGNFLAKYTIQIWVYFSIE